MEKSNALSVVVPESQVMISSWDNLLQRSEYFAKSSLIPTALRAKSADIAIILQMGWELGIPPMQALNGINVIQGKPSVSPELALALIRSRHPDAFIQFKELSESKAVVVMARDRNFKDEGYTATWDLDKARKMQLLDKDNYKKQPGNMLKWRAVMECARVAFPDTIKGLYSSDEVEDMKDVTPTNDKIKETNSILNEEVQPAVERPATQPVIDVEAVPVQEDPAEPGDYIVTFGLKYHGKKISDMPVDKIEKYLRDVEEAMKRPSFPAEYAGFHRNATAYLKQLKDFASSEEHA